MARTRSPNYPAISFGAAIDRVRGVYGQEHLHKASEETIARDLGYAGLNGKSIGILSALKKYGLLEGVEDGFRVSDDAVAILEFTPQSPERMEATRKCALAPALFNELYQEFGDLLPSEGNLRQFLIKRRFHPEKADDVIRVYRETLELVTEAERVYDSFHQTKKEKAPMQQPVTNPQVGASFTAFTAPASPDNRTTTELAFKLSRDSEARVILKGIATQEAIERLSKLLELQKDTFPTQAELTDPSAQPDESQPESEKV